MRRYVVVCSCSPAPRPTWGSIGRRRRPRTAQRHSADFYELESAVGKGTIHALELCDTAAASDDVIAGRLTQLTTRDQHRIV